MERFVLLLVTAVACLTPYVASGWAWLSAVATAAVGAVGFVITLRGEDRAVRAEERAEHAERRADEADRRELEAHEWQREQREAEQMHARAQHVRAAQVEQWVAEKKRVHGTAFFELDVAELGSARDARLMGLLKVKELHGADGSVIAAMCRAV